MNSFENFIRGLEVMPVWEWAIVIAVGLGVVAFIGWRTGKAKSDAARVDDRSDLMP